MPLQDSVMKGSALEDEQDQSRQGSNNSKDHCNSYQEDNRLSPRSPKNRIQIKRKPEDLLKSEHVSFRAAEPQNPLTQLSNIPQVQDGRNYGCDRKRNSITFKPLIPKEYHNK